MNNEDANQLDLLAVFHYVVGAITALFSCFPFIHVFMGLAIVAGKFPAISGSPGFPPDAAFGWIFVVMGSLFILFGWTASVCILLAGRKLKRRKNRIYCMAVAGVECMFVPFGTVLGVFTLIILNKDSVKQAFAQTQAAADEPPPLDETNRA